MVKPAPASAGERNEDGGAPKHDKRTVFVRNIPFDVDQGGLEALFGDVGPVRSAFLVSKKGAKNHSGFGFVQFAVPEDADRAVADLNGKALKGRSLQVSAAVKRAPLAERKRKQAEAEDGGGDGGGGAKEGAREGKAAEAAAAATDDAERNQQAKLQQQREQRQQQRREQQKEQRKQRQQWAKQPTTGGAAGAAAAVADPRSELIRTIALAGLTQEAIPRALEMARAAGNVVKVTSPAPEQLVERYKLRRDGASGDVAFVAYDTVKAALEAVTKLHRQPVSLSSPAGGGGGTEQQQKKKRRKGEQQEEEQAAGGANVQVSLWARQVAGEAAHYKKWRLIVRNLPFKASEADMLTAFGAAGFVWEVTLPRKVDGTTRGFAFVGYTSRGHAERAIRQLNGSKVAGRPIAVDWAVSKDQFQGGPGVAGAAGGRADHDDGASLSSGETDDEDMEERLAGGSDDDGDGGGDGAEGLSGSGWSDGEEDDGEGISGEEEEGEEGEGFEQQGEEDEQEGDALRSALDQILKRHSAGGGGSDDGEGDEGGDEAAAAAAERTARRKEKKERKKLEKRAVEEEEKKGQAGEDGAGVAAAGGRQAWEGEHAASAEGGKDGGEEQDVDARKQEALLRTVFVRGLPLDATKQMLQARLRAFGPVTSCRLVMDKATGNAKGTAFVEFREAAAAQAASKASAKARLSSGPSVTVAGRMVSLDLALGAQDVRSLAERTRGVRHDRRNLGLAKEGTIAEGTPAWQELSVQDRTKRKSAAAEKRLKLKSPNFVVSRTRLSVRNLPKDVDERALKRLFLDAVKARASKAQPVVRQAKILREADRTDGDGDPMSKGLGFVEFAEHEHALCALRQLNNNPDTFGREKRPIVEFAMENVKALKARESRQLLMQKQKQQRGKKQQGGNGEGEDGQQQQRGSGTAEVKGRKRARGTSAKDGGGDDSGRGEEGEGEGAAHGGGHDEDVHDGMPRRKYRRKTKAERRVAGGGGEEQAAAASLVNGVVKLNGSSGGGGSGGSACGKQALAGGKKQQQQQREDKAGSKPATVVGRGGGSGGGGEGDGGIEGVGGGKRRAREKRARERRARNGSGSGGGEGDGGDERRRVLGGGGGGGRGGDDGGKRRAREDRAIDGLAEAGMENGGARPAAKRQRKVIKKREQEREDGLDALVAQYKAKYFGGPAPKVKGGKGKKNGSAAAGGGKKKGSGKTEVAVAGSGLAAEMRRWFD